MTKHGALNVKLPNNLTTVPHLMLCFLYKLKLPTLTDLKLYRFCIMLYTGRNIHSLIELPVVHLTSILSPQVRTIYWNCEVVNGYYSMRGFRTCCPSLSSVYAL